MHHRHLRSSAHGCSTGTAAGLSVLAAAAAAGITYFLYGTEKGAEKRARMKEWADDTKETIKEKASFAKDEVTAAASDLYAATSSLLKKHSAVLRGLDREEMELLTARIREHWDEIKEDIEETSMRAREKAA